MIKKGIIFYLLLMVISISNQGCGCIEEVIVGKGEISIPPLYQLNVVSNTIRGEFGFLIELEVEKVSSIDDVGVISSGYAFQLCYDYSEL